MRAVDWSRAPLVADRRTPATGIPHYSSERQGRNVELLARKMNPGISLQNADRPNGSPVSQAGGGRSTGRRKLAVSHAAITLIELNPNGSAALSLLQRTTNCPGSGTDRHSRHTGEVFARYLDVIPPRQQEWEHE
jgi:hypothetical protein